MNSNISMAQLQAIANQAIAAHKQGNFPEAERLSLQLFRMDPVSPVARNILGLIRSHQARHAEAIDLLAAAVKADPKMPTNLANHGLVLQAAGRFAAALASYDAFLKLVPDHPVGLVNRANSLRSLKRYGESVACYDRALAKEPAYAEGHYNRAFTLAEMTRWQDALAGYDKAVAIKPGLTVAWVNRGNVLRALKRYDDALASYDKAFALDPRNAGAFYNRGVTLSDMNRTDDALASYDQAIALQPAFAPALTNRGNILRNAQRLDDALACYDKAVAAEPGNAEAHFNRGVVLADMKRFADAAESYAVATAAKPDHSDAFYNRGIALAELKRWGEALASYDKALTLKPDYVEVLNNRGVILQHLNHLDEALAAFDKAVAANPDYAEALYNRSYVRWRKLGGDAQAVRDLERVIEINPDYEYARGDLLHLRTQAGDWNGLAEEIAVIEAGMRAGKPTVRPFVYQAISGSPADLQTCAVNFSARNFPTMPAPPHSAPHDKIRIGYLSADFREQATAYLMAGLYECHDKDKFEILALDNGWDDGSAIRKRLAASFDKLIDISQLSDDDAAARIRAEGVDILVNLNGYFGTPRMGIFARKAAPIQINYLGFPSTLGADYIDYIVADRIVIPGDEHRYYTEKVVTLPGSYQVNDSKRATDTDVPTRAEHGLPDSGFVFCNFNQSYKLMPAAFGAWMRLLKEVDGSVLWMLEMNAALPDNLRREAASHGVDPERLVFAKHIPIAKHLARLSLADLFLDSLPYNAHTTASDSLWAGVPLITCRGTAFPGRVAASLLQAAGLPDLVTETPEDYHALALKLAHSPALLASYRQQLAQNRATCALFDTDRFRRNLESAYETMMARRHEGKAPAAFTVP
jgi:protein O-GlcNAc transferase